MAAGSSTTFKVTPRAEREIVLTREFDAPRELVFKVMTDPDLIPRWWGRRVDTTIVDKMEVRPGGKWRFITRGPEGETAFRGEIREVVPSERYVQTFEWEGLPGHVSVDTAVLDDIGQGRTRVTVTSLFDTAEDRDGMIKAGMEGGARQTYDRLAELLATLSVNAANKRVLTLTRVFDAPRDLVWRVCTEGEHLVHWMSSKTWETPSAEVDVRPGGAFRIKMRPQDRSEEGFMFEGAYAEVKKPERLVLRVGDGRLLTMTFDDAGGKTKLTLVIEMAMSEEQERQGYTEILDKLAGYLKSAA